MSKTAKIGIIIVIAGLLLGIGIATSMHFMNQNGNATTYQINPDPTQTAAPAPVAQKPVTVAQPPSAKDVASQVNCTDFTDQGKSQAGGVIDSGTCYINGSKYGVDTFASKTARDAWLVAAEDYGVSPKWETDTSVVYPSTDS